MLHLTAVVAASAQLHDRAITNAAGPSTLLALPAPAATTTIVPGPTEAMALGGIGQAVGRLQVYFGASDGACYVLLRSVKVAPCRGRRGRPAATHLWLHVTCD
eukprot:3550570-Prymnesium_polylepis.2